MAIPSEEGQNENNFSSTAHGVGVNLADILDVEKIQVMMDSFFDLTQFGIGIIDLNGQVLVATGWQDICTKFHRQNPESCRHCIDSDTLLSSGVPAGTYKIYKCGNGMWDCVTPIVVSGKHVGNLFLGQFFFDDEAPDYAEFRITAGRYGFDETDYIAALDRVPRWSRETVKRTMDFYTHFANFVLALSFNNFKLEQMVNERTQELASANEEMVVLNEDLERRVLEIKEKNIQLTRSNADLEQFAYVASHDLQEPLRQISSFTQLLARRYVGKFDVDADDFIGFIVDGTRRMQDLINDILVYSRLRKRDENLVTVNCEVLFTEVIVSMQKMIDDAEVRIRHDELPTLIGDRMQLAQLFRNLISNSIKFRGSEPPSIDITVKKQEEQWFFSFADNGIGIDPAYFERIFIVFQRLHSHAEFPGTGIGLAICKRVVENHGGKIWVESEAGKGSTFLFTINAKGS